MAMANPMEFVRQVRQEMRKVTWPSARETAVTTLMVLIMVALTAVFFLMVDAVLSWGVRTILDLGG